MTRWNATEQRKGYQAREQSALDLWESRDLFQRDHLIAALREAAGLYQWLAPLLNRAADELDPVVPDLAVRAAARRR